MSRARRRCADRRAVRDLPDLLRPGDVLVVNDTRVIPAQLTARRGAARIGITLTNRDRTAHGTRWPAMPGGCTRVTRWLSTATRDLRGNRAALAMRTAA